MDFSLLDDDELANLLGQSPGGTPPMQSPMQSPMQQAGGYSDVPPLSASGDPSSGLSGSLSGSDDMPSASDATSANYGQDPNGPPSSAPPSSDSDSDSDIDSDSDGNINGNGNQGSLIHRANSDINNFKKSKYGRMVKALVGFSKGYNSPHAPQSQQPRPTPVPALTQPSQPSQPSQQPRNPYSAWNS